MNSKNEIGWLTYLLEVWRITYSKEVIYKVGVKRELSMSSSEF